MFLWTVVELVREILEAGVENLFTSVAKKAIKLADDDTQLIALDIVRAMGENRAWHVGEVVALMDLSSQMAKMEREL